MNNNIIFMGTPDFAVKSLDFLLKNNINISHVITSPDKKSGRGLKMSKSEVSDYSRINLKDSSEDILKKIKKAKSDSESLPDNEKELLKRPEALNLLNIYADITGKKLDIVLKEMSGKEFSYLKTKLTDALVVVICPIGKKIKQLMDDKSYLTEVINRGKEKALIKAEKNLKMIREIVGLL